MKKIGSVICIILAYISLGIGVIGIILPLLPTTPFLLLAAFLFAKGSKRFHTWFIQTKLYKRYIEDVMVRKTMTLKSKISVLASVTIIFTIGFIFSPIWHAKAFIVVVAIFHYVYFLFGIKTTSNEKVMEKPVDNIEGDMAGE